MRLAILGLLILPIWGACRVYDPALVQDSCGSIVVPTRPDESDDGDGDDIVFVLGNVELDQGNEWAEIGYNLDGLCTNADDDPTECVPPAIDVPEFDGDGGIDNTFGSELFPTVALVLPNFEADARAAQAAGNGALIIKVQGWNGEDDDPHIDAIVSQTVDGTPGVGNAAPNAHFNADFELVDDDETVLPPPAWDGDDYFWVRSDTFLDGDEEEPLVRDDNAYVRDRIAVVRLPDRIDIWFFAGEANVTVRLTDAYATAQVSEDRMELENVIVTGRWAVNDMIDTASQLGVCDGTAQFDLLLSQLDRIADIRSRPGTGGPGVECDAISLGVRFHGTRAHWVGVAEGPPVPDGCDEE